MSESWPVVRLSDQALYLAHTAAGHEPVIQLSGSTGIP